MFYNIEIAVYFIQFNLYNIEIIGLEPELKFNYNYDNYWTKNENLNSICEKIDQKKIYLIKKNI